MVIGYGAGHGAMYAMINGEKIGITMIASQNVPFKLHPDHQLGDYVYFAAEDKVVKVPKDEVARAKFIEDLAKPVSLSAKTAEDKQACFEALVASPVVEGIGAQFRDMMGGAAGPTGTGPEVDKVIGGFLVKALRQEFIKKGSSGLGAAFVQAHHAMEANDAHPVHGLPAKEVKSEPRQPDGKSGEGRAR